MRWSRGFFRLWSILGVVWVGTSFAILRKDEFKGLWQPAIRLEIEFRGGLADTLDGSRPKEVLRQQIVDDVNRDAGTLMQKGDAVEASKQSEKANQSADELLKVIEDQTGNRSDRLYKSLTILLAPPAALLAIGIAFAWVATGFRKSV
jgi:hypothetical protein